MGGPRLARAGVVRSGGNPVHVLHDALRAPRRARETDARVRDGAEPGRIVERVGGRAHLRVRAAEGCAVSQRRSRHRGRREVLVRAVPGHRRARAQGPCRGDRRRRSPAHPVSAEAAVARLHGVLRHHGRRQWLGRAEEIRREGRRRRVQEDPGGRRPVPVRVVHSGRGAGARSLRSVLAQDTGREAAGLQGRPRRDDALCDAEAWRCRRRVCHARRAGRGGAANTRADAQGDAGFGDVLGSPTGSMGPKVSVARPARAPGREPRHRSSRDEPGGIPRARQNHLERHSCRLPLLLAAAGAWV
jgi:hypothetical protein